MNIQGSQGTYTYLPLAANGTNVSSVASGSQQANGRSIQPTDPPPPGVDDDPIDEGLAASNSDTITLSTQASENTDISTSGILADGSLESGQTAQSVQPTDPTPPGVDDDPLNPQNLGTDVLQQLIDVVV